MDHLVGKTFIVDIADPVDLSVRRTCEEKLGYLAWHEDAEARDKAGLRQVHCSTCSLWQWDLCERGRREPMVDEATGRCHDYTSGKAFPNRASFDRFVSEWTRNQESKRAVAVEKAKKPSGRGRRRR